MDSRTARSDVDPRTSLALWLRAGRAERKLSLDDVARATKIQPRILEQLETGQLEGLPADVFVRGFVKSFARCVGLSEGEALKRYLACAGATLQSSATARAFIETLIAAPARVRTASGTVPPPFGHPIEKGSTSAVASVPAPASADAQPAAVAAGAVGTDAVVVAAPVVGVGKSRKKPRGRRRKTAGQAKRQVVDVLAADSPIADSPIDDSPIDEAIAAHVVAVDSAPTAESADGAAATTPQSHMDNASAGGAIHVRVNTTSASGAEGALAVKAAAAAPSNQAGVLAQVQAPLRFAPWNRPKGSVGGTPSVPSLVIDDANPELAELQRDERDAAKSTSGNRVSFLPPILLDREERGGRQGGLTLAVILLLIAATLTLSYLMRQPSVSGDGVTVNFATDSKTVALLSR